MTAPIGKRGYPIAPQSSPSVGFNYLGWAEEIVGRGKPVEEFTREEHREALLIAKGELERLGLWPEQQKRNPPVVCPQGHQHASGKTCSDCQRIECRRQARDRKRAQVARERRSAA